jgi:outer membrane immunogenic protein
MKPHFLATVSSVALAGVASAADLPARMPTKAPVAPVAATWTGFYLGINGGAVWHRAEFDGVDAVSGTYSGTAEPTGGTFGGQIGYNWQIQNFVLGVEADWNWVGADGSGSVTNWGGGTLNTDLSWLATVRGRAGVLISPPTLIYATGGYAAGRVENSTNAGGGFVNNETRSGWTVGGGIEHRFAPQWSVKAEVLYVDLGSSTVQGVLGSGYAGTFENTAVVARVGLNFKF